MAMREFTVEWRDIDKLAQLLAHRISDETVGNVRKKLERHPPAQNPHMLFDFSVRLDCLPMDLVRIIDR